MFAIENRILLALRDIYLLLGNFFEFNGAGNLFEGTLRPACTADSDRAISKDSSYNTLVDLNAFGFFQKYFDGTPANKSGLGQHSLIGNPKLRSGKIDDGRNDRI